MNLSIGIRNALTTYYTWLIRKNLKPYCLIPIMLTEKPEIFKNEESFIPCTCINKCRFCDPDNNDDVILLENYIKKNLLTNNDNEEEDNKYYILEKFG